MLPEELDRSIQKLKAEGKLPYFVNATSGSTVLGAYDDLSALAAVCRWVSRDTCRNNTRVQGSQRVAPRGRVLGRLGGVLQAAAAPDVRQ